MDETVQMALFVSRNLPTASSVELQVACNVLARINDSETDDAFVRCFHELGRRMAEMEAKP